MDGIDGELCLATVALDGDTVPQSVVDANLGTNHSLATSAIETVLNVTVNNLEEYTIIFPFFNCLNLSKDDVMPKVKQTKRTTYLNEAVVKMSDRMHQSSVRLHRLHSE